MQPKNDPCRTPQLMQPATAIKQMLEQINTTEHTEIIYLPQSLGRVLAENIHSSIDLPPFNNSAMDGYAFRFEDIKNNATLTCIGSSFAGHPFTDEYQANSCIRIMTGGLVPDCYDTVQMQEKAQVNGNNITFELPENQGQFVRLRAKEITAGAQILTQGTQINAAEMGVLATIGTDSVRVYKKIKIAFFSTGDELRPVGTELGLGQIYDSNRYTILGMLERAGFDCIDLGVVKDDPESLRQVFQQAEQQADLILTSGGVSVGDADFTKQILAERGKISFWNMAMKPGKPFAYGKLGNAIFCGMPGNPVSSMVTFYKLVWPILCKMQGLPQPQEFIVKAKLKHDIKKLPGRMEYQRGILTTNENGELTVSTTGGQDSGMLTSMSIANCFVVLPQMQGNTESGTFVDVEPFKALFN